MAIPTTNVIQKAKPAVLLGLDIGTSGVRASLFDSEAAEIAGASVSQERSGADYSLLDADAIVALTIDTIDQLLAKPAAANTNIELVAVSCFWHSLLGIDETGSLTTPLLGWADIRAGAAARELRERLDETEIHRRTGCRLHPSYWPAKLLWLKKEHAGQFQTTSRWLSLSEYLALKLFDAPVISVSMASGTGLLDQKTCDWDRPLVAELGIAVESLPEIGGGAFTESRLKSEYTLRWPQLRMAKLAPAIGDGAANSIGAGCTARDKLALMIGTSGAARVLFEGEPPAQIPDALWSYRADRKRVLVGGAHSDGGGLYRRLRESLLPEVDSNTLLSELGSIPADGHGLTILPFWAGERSTGWSLDARGGIFGLTQETKPVEILRAAMEAIAYRLALIVRALEQISLNPTIIASGNALQSSPVWVQIIADVIGSPVVLSNTREASTRGAALLALEAAGKIETIDKVDVLGARKIEPDRTNHARYQKAVERQQRLYEAVIT